MTMTENHLEARNAFYNLSRDLKATGIQKVQAFTTAENAIGRKTGIAYWDAAYNALKRIAQ